jgi:hypothetical protein
MDVAEATELATDWVKTYASRNLNFRGAHLMGSIVSLPKDAPFPSYGDLDIGVLVEPKPEAGHEMIEEWHRGVAIEAGLRGLADYRTPEQVLTNPDLASNLAAASVIADPIGLLGRIQPIIASEYGRRRWVAARSEAEKGRVLAALDGASQSKTATDVAVSLIAANVYLAGLVAVAMLRPPTHRKALLLLRELLLEEGREDLHEETLAVCGFGHVTASRAAAYLERSALAFDRAIEVKRTPSPFDFKLRSFLRPYAVDSTRSMIDAGDHREAMPWLGVSLFISTAALHNDAPEAERDQYDLLWREFLDDMGLADPASWPDRLHRAAALKDVVFELADQIVARRSDSTPTTSAVSGS